MRWITVFKSTGLALLSVAALLGWAALRPRAGALPPPVAPVESPPDAGSGDLDAGPPEDPTIATITFITQPNVTALVTWGKKPLGKILPGKPLVVVRPRDSGPLDVMVRASGFLAVQTRAHTFSNSRVLVKLTPPERKSELLGYRIPLEAGVDGAIGWPEGLEGGISFGLDAGPGLAPNGQGLVSPVAPVAPAPVAPPPLITP
jgi:hypothetical protein